MIEMLGKKFGKLLVVSENGYRGKIRMWDCICDCGERRIVAGTGLRIGTNKSCGCSSPRFKSDRIKTPKMCGTPTYYSWSGMLHRCSDKAKGKSRRLYFEKGIKVCDKWHTFEGFIEDMGVRPYGTSIERKNGNEGYCKENCFWASYKQQANNTTANRKLRINGITKNVSQWADETGILANTIIYRLKRGWTHEKSVNPNAISIRLERKMKREKSCLICGNKFIPRISQLKVGRGNFCSQKCNGANKLTCSAKEEKYQ